MESETIEIVKDAYRRLKSHVYYDSSSLHLRKDISIFEESPEVFEENIKNLSDELDRYQPDSNYWNNLMREIDYLEAVKEFEINDTTDDVIHSRFKNKTYKSVREVLFCKMPIELHIIATIFVKSFGCELENSLFKTPYGNKLDTFQHDEGNSISAGLKLYKPYFNEYKSWRNRAIESVQALSKRGKNSLLVSLDIKDFYSSSRVDFNQIEKLVVKNSLPKLLGNVFEIFVNIHKNYMQCLGFEPKDDLYLLPIGLISSGVIANWYLNEFDKAIVKKLGTDYYGRYVDDVLLVIPFENGKKVGSKNEIIQMLFCDNGLFAFDEDCYQISVQGLECLQIQEKKFQVIHFVSDELASLLDKYINDTKKTSSEYRLLSDEETIDADFDEHAFNLEYSGSGRGLNEIKGFSDDKFGISNYIGKKLSLALQGVSLNEKEDNAKLLKLFKGPMVFEMYRLWEKLFTYFLVSKEMKSFHQLINQIISAINGLEKENEYDKFRKLKLFYLNNLIMAIGMPYALKPSILLSISEEKKLNKIFDLGIKKTLFYKFIDAIRSANTVRHKYIQSPLINYLIQEEGKHCDLIHHDDYLSTLGSSLKLCEHKKTYSPRFVNFDEIMSFHVLKTIIGAGNGLFPDYQNSLEFDYLSQAFIDYQKINQSSLSSDSIEHLRKQLCELNYVSDKDEKFYVRNLNVSDENRDDVLRIGLVSMVVPDVVISQKYIRKPFVSLERRKDLRKILNLAEEEKAEVLVFPEISIPVSSFFWLVEYARLHQRAMVFGLEHWLVNKHALNLVVTLFPLMVNGYKSLIINLRLKNHYSPEEENVLTGYGYKIPQNPTPYYDLITWRGVALTVFNCYELCNINHRAYFRSKIDVLFASEFNKDVNYFSSIVESTSRDLHCYVVQSNDSKFGDSRISQPTSTLDRDLVKIKGGLNPSVIIGELNIDALRNFQVKNYNGQREDKAFKPTPPDFEKDEVMRRIKI